MVELWITGGDRNYVYRSDENKLRWRFLQPSELDAVRTPTVSTDADGPALLAAATAAVSTAFPLAKAGDLLAYLNGKYKWKYGGKVAGKYAIGGVAVVGCLAILGGGAYLGYWLGYKGEEPPYGSADFQSALMNSDLWCEAAKQHLPPAVQPANTPDESPQMR